MKRREQGAKINDNESLVKILLTGVSKRPIFGPLLCVKSVQIRSFFWSIFSCIRTEYGDLLRKSPYSV